MAVPRTQGRPWTRKHDDPRRPLLPSVAATLYPRTLEHLVDITADTDTGEALHAAGSHWGLSTAALSDHTFIETHDPGNAVPAMGRTLHEVVPGALTDDYLRWMAQHDGDERWSLVHVESGKRIYQLYAELDQVEDADDEKTLAGVLKQQYGADGFAGPWGFATLGGAGGQTVVGALSTGTHGGDFDRPPLADSVLAIHLVTDEGVHYWIEPDDPDLPQLTDDDALNAAYGRVGDFKILRDNDVFDSVLVSAGRFGVIYSVVLRAVPQYSLLEKRRLHLWQDVKSEIARLDSPLWQDAPPPGVGEHPQRFLQVAVCLTTHAAFTRNLAGVTKRWTTDLPADPPGRAERVGGVVASIDPLIGAPRFENAGTTHAYSPDPDNPQRGADPGLLETACANADFLTGLINEVVDELEAFGRSKGSAVGPIIAAVAGVGAGGLIALAEAVLTIVDLLRDLLRDLRGTDTRFGEVLDGARKKILDPGLDPLKHAAGVFAWQLIMYVAFSDQQSDRDYEAISYAVMDQHDYVDVSCNVNVRSIEVFFDATDSRLTAFIDALIAFEAEQEERGLAFIGYASLRFTQPTRALIGMQRFPVSCAVEVACLADVEGGPELVAWAANYACHPMIGGILHWGQDNPASAAVVQRWYGTRLDRWRDTFRVLGQATRFSNEFTRGAGLEP